MRVPRKKLGPFSAKLMHDIDGLVGLWVYNRLTATSANIWYCFGDTYLHSTKLEAKQWQLLPHRWGKREPEVNPDLTFEYAVAAVGSAFKQLHYTAYALRRKEPTPPDSKLPSAMVQTVLDANGPAPSLSFGTLESRSLAAVVDDTRQDDLVHAANLRNETLAPGSAGDSGLWPQLRMTVDEADCVYEDSCADPDGDDVEGTQVRGIREPSLDP